MGVVCPSLIGRVVAPRLFGLEILHPLFWRLGIIAFRLFLFLTSFSKSRSRDWEVEVEIPISGS